MNLENRYIVVKRTDLRNMDVDNKSVGFSGTPSANLKTAMESVMDNVAEKSRIKAGKKPLECIVIESDWPEYETVKAMLINRIKGIEASKDSSVKRDAERYQWILSSAKATDALFKHGLPKEIAERNRHINNAIDEAIKESS